MSVNLAPLSARSYSVGASRDPHKKYWWAILGGFILTGVWLCLPSMETSVGSVHVDTTTKASIDASSAEQNLDSADNPNGAAGGALDLSMDGAKRKSKSDEEMTSMLYQGSSEPGAAAAGAPLGTATAASSASLAQQLKDAGKPKDAAGWSEKAQAGFAAPHLSGGALGGLGSASGGSSASAGGSGGAFGFRGANVGSESAKGLHDDGSAETSAGFKALKSAAGSVGGPSLKGSSEDMHAAGSAVFDGKKGNVIAGKGTGAFASAGSALNAAPANLKQNDPTLDVKKLPDPPAAPTPASTGSNMAQQMLEMVAMAAVGGIVGGMAGQMIAMMGSTMIQQQQAAAAQQKQTATTMTGSHG
jgi:hypothetical protein